MAKKGQAVQLIAEINTDDEWDKLLLKDGLIVADVYSEWCGPCSGMAATLKKLKLEIGGDLLHLATAKSDKITALTRFRNKSEPTWMFISCGKMVNFMFGANAPKLTRLISDELKKENDVREMKGERIAYDINELAEEEKQRLEVVENIAREAREKEEAKASKELYERRKAEALKILEGLNHLGVILVFPHVKSSYQEAFGDLLGEAGLTISQTEKFVMTQEQLEEIFYFGENPFDEDLNEELLNEQSLILLIKPIPARAPVEETWDIILEIVYGAMKKAPGSKDSPAQVLMKVPPVGEIENQEGQELEERVGIWVPEDELIRATAFRLFFPKISQIYFIAPPDPTPPHYAVIFDAIRRAELAELMAKYKKEILRYGFFTSDVPEEAQLVAKTAKKYERAYDRAPEQKLVLQLAKTQSECVFTFVQLNPLYISPNTIEGERECKFFFPDDYDKLPEEEEEEEDVENIDIIKSDAVVDGQDEEVDKEEEVLGEEEHEEEEEEEEEDEEFGDLYD